MEAIAVGAAVHDEVSFTEFVLGVEPRLRRALVAAYGAELGREATADALAYAWQHWDRVATMSNPAGYLWRVGQTSVRRTTNRRRIVVSMNGDRADETVHEIAVEPALDHALAALSPQQRAAVVLVHGHGMSLSETAATLGCSVSTVRNHVARAMRRLQQALEVNDD